MAVTITTADAEGLWWGILSVLDRRDARGWECDGESFTLTGCEYAGRAWFRAFPEPPGRLVLGLVPAEGGALGQDTYAAYHGRLVELLLAHFGGAATAVQVTPAVTYPDLMHWTGESRHAPRAGQEGEPPDPGPGAPAAKEDHIRAGLGEGRDLA
jgi:hypothetical protein